MKEKKQQRSFNQSTYKSGSMVIFISLCLLLYLAFTQAYEIFYVKELEPQKAMAEYADSLLKSGVMVLAASVLWYFYTFQEYHTVINELLDIFSDSTGGMEEACLYVRDSSLAQLVDSAAGMAENNKLYRTQLDRQKKLLLNNYLVRLMKGRIKDIPAAYETGEFMNVNLRADHLQVIVFGFTEEQSMVSDEDMDDVIAYLQTLIDKMLLAVFKGYLTEIDGMFACLLVSAMGVKLDSRDSMVELKRTTMLIRQLMLDQKECSVRISAGGISTGISGIEKSFSEAMELFQYAKIINEDDSVLFYQETQSIHSVDTDDYFWFKKEMQFMNCINAADYQNAALVFFEILDGDYMNSGLPLNLLNCRMLGLINSMINAMGKIRLTVDADFFERLDPGHTILDCRSIPELKRKSREIFYSLNNYAENQKRQSAYSRLTEIVEYMKENYSDAGLCVTSIAEQFEMNPSYLSRMFKKLMGIGISDYLQQVRIAAAEELLKDKRLSVQEVSESVGYSSVQTMNRNFKKYKGITAGKTREHSGEQEE